MTLHFLVQLLSKGLGFGKESQPPATLGATYENAQTQLPRCVVVEQRFGKGDALL